MITMDDLVDEADFAELFDQGPEIEVETSLEQPETRQETEQDENDELEKKLQEKVISWSTNVWLWLRGPFWSESRIYSISVCLSGTPWPELNVRMYSRYDKSQYSWNSLYKKLNDLVQYPQSSKTIWKSEEMVTMEDLMAFDEEKEEPEKVETQTFDVNLAVSTLKQIQASNGDKMFELVDNFLRKVFDSIFSTNVVFPVRSPNFWLESSSHSAFVYKPLSRFSLILHFDQKWDPLAGT